MTDRKAVIKNADMSEDMQQDAVDCATQAMEKYNIEKDIAAYIKKCYSRLIRHYKCKQYETNVHKYKQKNRNDKNNRTD
uniref:Dynein light chain n=1 Tax=Dicentrarchus labrax TaxID=13489 RepID=A0A8P4GDN3_DICLA